PQRAGPRSWPDLPQAVPASHRATACLATRRGALLGRVGSVLRQIRSSSCLVFIWMVRGCSPAPTPCGCQATSVRCGASPMALFVWIVLRVSTLMSLTPCNWPCLATWWALKRSATSLTGWVPARSPPHVWSRLCSTERHQGRHPEDDRSEEHT